MLDSFVRILTGQEDVTAVFIRWMRVAVLGVGSVEKLELWEGLGDEVTEPRAKS